MHHTGWTQFIESTSIVYLLKPYAFEVWAKLSTVQIIYASISLARWRICLYNSRYKPGGGCTAWVRGGENPDYRVGEKMTKQMEETISPPFSSCLCSSWIHFFPIVRVFFSCWLKHSRTEPAIRQWGEEVLKDRGGKKRIERGVGDRHKLWQRCLSWWSVGSKLEACLKGERRERGVGVGMN